MVCSFFNKDILKKINIFKTVFEKNLETKSFVIESLQDALNKTNEEKQRILDEIEKLKMLNSKVLEENKLLEIERNQRESKFNN